VMFFGGRIIAGPASYVMGLLGRVIVAIQ
jgi:hypothetical protein